MLECGIVGTLPAEGGLFILHKGKTFARCFFTLFLRNFQTLRAEKEKFPHGLPQELMKTQVLHGLDGDC